MQTRRFLAFLGAAAMVPMAGALSGCFANKPSFASVDITGAEGNREFLMLLARNA